jgi:hypothetical protein
MEKFLVDVSYQQICVFLADQPSPFNDWTEQQVLQGFAWRPGSVSFRTFGDGRLAISVTGKDESCGASTAVRIIRVPFLIPDGSRVEAGSIFESQQLELPSGEYALTFEHGHDSDGAMWCHLLFEPVAHAVQASVLRADNELKPGEPLLMNAEPA